VDPVHLGQIHAAMGILTTLDALLSATVPADKYLLRALITATLWHYLPAKRARKS